MVNKYLNLTQTPFAVIALGLLGLSAAQAAPINLNATFLGGVFGSFNINYVSGATGLQLQEVRIDLQSPLFTDPTFAPPGALLPRPFLSVTGASETGFTGVANVNDGSHSFSLLFTDFDPSETFAFLLDVDSPCGSFFCQASAALVTGPEFAGTQITTTFGGTQFKTTNLASAFTATHSLTAAATVTGDVGEVPEPQSVALVLMGLAPVMLHLRRRHLGKAVSR